MSGRCPEPPGAAGGRIVDPEDRPLVCPLKRTPRGTTDNGYSGTDGEKCNHLDGQARRGAAGKGNDDDRARVEKGP